MTPQEQLIKGYNPEEGIFGDCHRTCFAVILDLSPKDVPHFMHGVRVGDDQGDVDSHIAKWLSLFGLTAASFPYDGTMPLDDFLAWMAEVNPGMPFILGGASPRGDFAHSVVCLDGEVVCDPVTGKKAELFEALAGPTSDGFWWVTVLAVGSNWGD